MDYWESLEYHRRRSGYYNPQNKSSDESKKRVKKDEEAPKKVARNDKNISILLDPDTTFNLLGLVKFKFPSGLDLSIESPILEGLLSKETSSSYIEKIVDQLKSGNLVQITRIQ